MRKNLRISMPKNFIRYNLNFKENVKIAICFGTRPEIIKLSLLSEKLTNKYEVLNVFTGQHHSLYEDVKRLIPIIHQRIPLLEYENLNLLYADLIKGLYDYFNKEKPNLIIVQGDTASSYCGAFCAFMMGIKIGHVEAGLRTNDMFSPYPEEFNRQMIGKIADYNWCPSQSAAENLKREGANGKIIFTGNTIVDFIHKMCDISKIIYKNEIVVTLHRRENKELFSNMLEQINREAITHPSLNFVFPVHPNPNIRKQLNILTAPNVLVREPMRYEDFLLLLLRCKGIITDSGGIQEEALCLRKKTLICRNNTERKEGVNIGITRLVGNEIEENFEWLLTPFEKEFDNPYGDGDACTKIINSIKDLK